MLVTQLGAGAGLVKHVDGLVRQKSVGNVAIGLRNCGRKSLFGIAKLVKSLIAFDNSLNYLKSLGFGRRLDLDRLETTFESAVFFYRFAKFVWRGRSDALNIATRESGL